MAPIMSIDAYLPASGVEQRKAVLEVCIVSISLEGYPIADFVVFNNRRRICSTYDRKAHLPNRLPNISPAYFRAAEQPQLPKGLRHFERLVQLDANHRQ